MELVKLDINELVELYQSGVSLRQLAAKYSTSKITIKKKLVKAGIDILCSKEFIEKHNDKFRADSGRVKPKVRRANDFDFALASRRLWKSAYCDSGLDELYERFVTKASLVHSAKYTYPRSGYSGPNVEAKIICPTHGEFAQMPHSHTKGHGCPICSRKTASERRSLGPDGFVKRAIRVHNGKYDYSKVNYINNKTAVDIICPDHGIFSQMPMVHLRGRGCPSCLAYDTNRFINKSGELHNNKYDYANVSYLNSKSKVSIACPVHGEFMQTPNAHLNGHGCLLCARENTASKGEDELYEYISSLTADVVRHSRTVIGPLELDLFIPSRMLAVEYNGIYWHSYGSNESEDKLYHARKYQQCADKGIQLIQITEDEWADHTKRLIIKSKLSHLLGETPHIIYARNCTVRRPSNDDYVEFMEANHIQGSRDARHIIALVNNNRYVAMGSFNKYMNGFEIIRYACSRNTHVVGGFSKILDRFNSEQHPNYVISYADRRYSNGNLYIKCGFKLAKVCSPNYRYVRDGMTYSRQRFQKHKLRGKLDKYDDSLTESDNMFNNGYRRLWDAGHFKFVKYMI